MKKNKVCFFFLCFIGFMLIMVIVLHTFETRGGAPMTWKEIILDWPFFLVTGCILSGLATAVYSTNKKK